MFDFDAFEDKFEWYHELLMIDTNSNTKTFVDSQELQINRKMKSKVLN